MKKIIAVVMAALLSLGAFSTVFALEAGESRVVMGADLTQSQRAEIYEYFGIEEGSVYEITVTNADERLYFEGKLPDAKLGHVARSCIYIVATDEGSGLNIETKNINYCTAEMYQNALITAGIADADIKVCAPYELSGTAALTGIYKAYEDMTGRLLNEFAKDAGIEELIATGELAEYVGSEEATQIITEVKKILDETQHMSDEDVLQRIHNIAADYDVTLTDDLAQQIFSLCRMFEGLDVDEIQARLVNMANAAQKAQTFGEFLSNAVESIGEFFKSIGEFFVNIWNKWFGGDDADANQN